MSWRHRDILEAELHEPKGFTTANNGDSIWRNEQGLGEWTDREVLPAALNFVDASVAPPTTASGDIYVLSLGASIHANWGTVALKDWVRYDGTSWKVITPSKSILCYDKTLDVLMAYSGSVWATVGSDTNLATTNLTQTDLERSYNRSALAGISKLRFRGTNQLFQWEDGGVMQLYAGSADAVGAIPSVSIYGSGANIGNINFRNGGATIKTVGNDLVLKGQASGTIPTFIELGINIVFNVTSPSWAAWFKSNKVNFKSCDASTFYGSMDTGVFVWSTQTTAPAPIGSEKFSIQENTLIKGSDTSASTKGFKVTNSANTSLLEVKNNGVINASNLPTSSAGLSSGDIWNNSGVLNIV